ncbi:hypothetical protein Q5752_004981 [Cryptotrichosporon argae]
MVISHDNAPTLLDMDVPDLSPSAELDFSNFFNSDAFDADNSSGSESSPTHTPPHGFDAQTPDYVNPDPAFFSTDAFAKPKDVDDATPLVDSLVDWDSLVAQLNGGNDLFSSLPPLPLDPSPSTWQQPYPFVAPTINPSQLEPRATSAPAEPPTASARAVPRPLLPANDPITPPLSPRSDHSASPLREVSTLEAMRAAREAERLNCPIAVPAGPPTPASSGADHVATPRSCVSLPLGDGGSFANRVRQLAPIEEVLGLGQKKQGGRKGGAVSSVVRREGEDLSDGQEWRPGEREWTDMDPELKRRMRNRRSAAVHRVRKKEYAEALEQDVRQRTNLLSEAAERISSLEMENNELKAELAAMKSAARTVSNDHAPQAVSIGRTHRRQASAPYQRRDARASSQLLSDDEIEYVDAPSTASARHATPSSAPSMSPMSDNMLGLAPEPEAAAPSTSSVPRTESRAVSSAPSRTTSSSDLGMMYDPASRNLGANSTIVQMLNLEFPRANLNPSLNAPVPSPSSLFAAASPPASLSLLPFSSFGLDPTASRRALALQLATAPSAPTLNASSDRARDLSSSFADWALDMPFTQRTAGSFNSQIWCRLAREQAAERAGVPRSQRPKFLVAADEPRDAAPDIAKAVASSAIEALTGTGSRPGDLAAVVTGERASSKVKAAAAATATRDKDGPRSQTAGVSPDLLTAAMSRLTVGPAAACRMERRDPLVAIAGFVGACARV